MNATNTNLIDITDMTDAALGAYLAAVADADAVVIVDHLTVTERHQIATALGFVAPACWLLDAPEPTTPRGPDYEEAILARQDIDA